MNETTRLYTRDGIKTIDYEVYIKLLKHCEDLEKKLQAENAKLRECVMLYANYKNDSPDSDWNNEFAGQILKESST